VRFTFGKFVKGGSMGSLSSYNVDVIAVNLWSKPIPEATFDAFFFAKDNTRIGNGYISLNHMGAGEKVRFTVSFSVTGAQPVSLKIVATHVPKELGPLAPPKKIRLTVYSVPSGAKLTVDGTAVGETPKQVEFTQGKHLLEFNREGYNHGSYPVEFGPDDVSGGTVSYELGALAHDTVEMRDGSTLTADVQSMDPTSVVVRVGGNLQTLDRNQVRRILLTQREPASGETQK
jgi:PEGA domain